MFCSNSNNLNNVQKSAELKNASQWFESTGKKTLDDNTYEKYYNDVKNSDTTLNFNVFTPEGYKNNKKL